MDALADQRLLVGCPFSEATLGAAIFPPEQAGPGCCSHVSRSPGHAHYQLSDGVERVLATTVKMNEFCLSA